MKIKSIPKWLGNIGCDWTSH